MKFADMHCDTISRLFSEREKTSLGYSTESLQSNRIKNTLRSNQFHLDLERMKEANYALQTFAMFVYLNRTADPFTYCNQMIDFYFSELHKNSDLIRPVLSYEDILKNEEMGKMSALLSIEEGEACLGEIENLKHFYQRGVRMMTLTWNFENSLAYPNIIRDVLNRPNKTHGLKAKGFEFLEAMEAMKIILDVSHLGDAGILDVLENTKKPFIASHSNARAVTNHVRNLTDDMISQMGDRGCIAGLNFGADFTTDTPEMPYGSLDMLVEHVRYMTDLGGMDFVALGTDFDGISNKDIELKNCSMMPRLFDALQKAGFHESEIDKICYKNFFRILKELL
ncbi:MAG: dipeptidase [Lachnospiraceae bacterium]